MEDPLVDFLVRKHEDVLVRVSEFIANEAYEIMENDATARAMVADPEILEAAIHIATLNALKGDD